MFNFRVNFCIESRLYVPHNVSLMFCVLFLISDHKEQGKLQTRFWEWPNLNIRLDIWHFMRQLAAGCTTDAHCLHGKAIWMHIWVGPTWHCSFASGEERAAGRERGAFNRRITKKDLALFCCRKTCGVETTICLIKHLLQELKEKKGRDLLGVPLLDTVRMEHIWRVQKRREVPPGCARCDALHRDEHHHYQGTHSSHQIQVCQGLNISWVIPLSLAEIHYRFVAYKNKNIKEN